MADGCLCGWSGAALRWVIRALPPPALTLPGDGMACMGSAAHFALRHPERMDEASKRRIRRVPCARERTDAASGSNADRARGRPPGFDGDGARKEIAGGRGSRARMGPERVSPARIRKLTCAQALLNLTRSNGGNGGTAMKFSVSSVAPCDPSAMLVQPRASADLAGSTPSVASRCGHANSGYDHMPGTGPGRKPVRPAARRPAERLRGSARCRPRPGESAAAAAAPTVTPCPGVR